MPNVIATIKTIKMEKKISDYLPLYVGCMVQYTGMANPRQLTMRWLGSLLETDAWKNIKPILRPLSDMNEEERKELWRMIFSEGGEFSEMTLNYRGNTVWIDKKSRQSEPRWVMQQGVERLGIEMNGTVWADCDLHNWKHNQHEVTKWLLSKHFDLFGLIESGLAIDSTTKQLPI